MALIPAFLKSVGTAAGIFLKKEFSKATIGGGIGYAINQGISQVRLMIAERKLKKDDYNPDLFSGSHVDAFTGKVIASPKVIDPQTVEYE